MAKPFWVTRCVCEKIAQNVAPDLKKIVPKSFISPFEHTNNAYLYTTALLGTFSLNTLYPGGIRTQVFLFPSGCGANCVTPRDGVAPIFLRKVRDFLLAKE
jgi:hypothetical protein